MRVDFGWACGLAVAAAGLCGAGVAQTGGGLANGGQADGISTDGVQDALAASVVSHVRIVRLSDIRERVELDRGTGKGFEQTITNMPIVQGNKLRAAQGWAEVEFEDNSSLRITPNSEVEFRTLGRTATGSTVDVVNLVRGTMYVSLQKIKGNDFVVSAAGETMTLPPGGHIRLDVYPAGNELYVFQGRVQVTDATGERVIEKDRSLTFGGPAEAAPVVARDRTPGMWDLWDQKAVDFHSFRANSVSPYAYGQADLNYYGSFANVAGCGQMWRPYFTSASFDPFANGVWALYPGAGYSYVSPYPWGWVPYHTGSWANCGGGWGWQPSGGWTGVQNHQLFKHLVSLPGTHPIHPPVAGGGSLVVVGGGRLAVSHLKTADGSFVFERDSAGLGVPRDSFGKLGKISNEVALTGSSTRPAAVAGGAASFAGTEAGGGTSVSSTARPNGGSTARPTAGSVGLVSRPVMTGGSTVSGGRGGGLGPVASSGGGYGGGSHSAPAPTSVGSPSVGGGSAASASSASGTSAHH